MTLPEDMRRAWDALAKENPRFYVATAAWKTESEFEESGRRDVEQFFGGIDHVLTPSTVALDIGCGMGRMDRYVARRVQRLVGIDISPEMVRLARTRLADIDNVKFIEGDGTSLSPLDDAEFDLVFSYITFQHLADVEFRSYVRDCARVLRVNGHFVFQVVEALAEVPEIRQVDAFSTRFHDEGHTRTVLESAGFDIASVVRGRIDTEVMPCNFVRFHAVSRRNPCDSPGTLSIGRP